MSTNLSGRLLIASPYLTDGNFMRSVIFIVRHDAEGAFGLLVNRPTERRFRDLVEASSGDGEPRNDDHIYRGGPVDGPLLALHDLVGVGDSCDPIDAVNAMISPGQECTQGVPCNAHDPAAEPWGAMSIEFGNSPVWITGVDDHLRILLQRPEARVRYVSDYSGWGPGQLDEELRVGGWLIGEADPNILFGDPDDAWENAVQQCGQKILTGIAPGVHFGDPSMN